MNIGEIGLSQPNEALSIKLWSLARFSRILAIGEICLSQFSGALHIKLVAIGEFDRSQSNKASHIHILSIARLTCPSLTKFCYRQLAVALRMNQKQ